MGKNKQENPIKKPLTTRRELLEIREICRMMGGTVSVGNDTLTLVDIDEMLKDLDNDLTAIRTNNQHLKKI